MGLDEAWGRLLITQYLIKVLWNWNEKQHIAGKRTSLSTKKLSTISTRSNLLQPNDAKSKSEPYTQPLVLSLHAVVRWLIPSSTITHNSFVDYSSTHEVPRLIIKVAWSIHKSVNICYMSMKVPDVSYERIGSLWKSRAIKFQKSGGKTWDGKLFRSRIDLYGRFSLITNLSTDRPFTYEASVTTVCGTVRFRKRLPVGISVMWRSPVSWLTCDPWQTSIRVDPRNSFPSNIFLFFLDFWDSIALKFDSKPVC